MLDARGIAYETKTYDASGAFDSADEAAALLGVGVETVYKTLVGPARGRRAGAGSGRRPNRPEEARQQPRREAAHGTLREAEHLTGMQAGGISALGLLRPVNFDVLIDETARRIETIHISAGVRGVDLAVNVNDFVVPASARYVRQMY